MTLQEFAEQVKAMREAQKTYFKTKGGLSDCKDRERSIDKAVKDILSPPGLFGEED